MELVLVLCLVVLVVFVALKRGLVWALGVAFSSGIISWFLDWDAIFPIRHFYGKYALSLLPFVVFVLLAILVGREISALGLQLEMLGEQHEKLKKDSGKIMLRNRQLDEVRIQLEKRILKDDTLALKLHEAVERLDSLRPEQILDELLQLVTLFTRARSVTWYRFREDTFLLTNSMHSKIEVKAQILPGEVLYKLLSTESVAVTFRDHPEIAMDETLVACSLRTISGVLLGAVLIHELDFFDLNRPNILLFEKLCHWASKAVERAMEYRDQSSRTIHYKGTRVFNMAFFHHSLTREYQLCRRYGSHATVVSFFIQHPTDLVDLDQTVLRLGMILEKCFRNVDSMFFNDHTLDRFHVQLPMTPETGADIAAGKFLLMVEEEGVFPYNSKSTPIRLESQTFFMHKDLEPPHFQEYLARQGVC